MENERWKMEGERWKERDGKDNKKYSKNGQLVRESAPVSMQIRQLSDLHCLFEMNCIPSLQPIDQLFGNIVIANHIVKPYEWAFDENSMKIR